MTAGRVSKGMRKTVHKTEVKERRGREKEGELKAEKEGRGQESRGGNSAEERRKIVD